MVNFMCDLDWAMGCIDIWSNIISGVSIRVFLGEFNIQIGESGKQIALPSVSGPHLIH